ncbi:hypothetical protein Psta_0773 [Pirellula staleyi DSM 6068]|uniref:Uncharacterized protein n=1 Tax=Pirellula staleyi (strain ATCC 27377 / DSM 6068 / ICPB 4128) TaxID=530564 RepID=D2R680_PIRSD|nr:hypothetical protein [Pirellula staleyi]ADB15458.1 hypothetical protein Psta_0773 [Pirellula staleyi DSM 6068]
MATIEYSLFRIKFIRPSQQSFLYTELTPQEVFKISLKERPSIQLSGGRTWHIGNVQDYDSKNGYFAFGRTSKTTNTTFDDSTGNFVEKDFETSPYTHVVFNSTIGILGIAHNHRLGRSSVSISAKLERAFEATSVVTQNNIEVVIAPISDPEGFLKTVLNAYRILKFTAHFTGPNPFDADEFFQRPLSVYASTANAKKGKAMIAGESLNKDVVAEVARSTAATGNKATAQLKKYKNQAPVTIGLTEEPIKRRFDESTHDPQIVISELKSLYDQVRHND